MTNLVDVFPTYSDGQVLAAPLSDTASSLKAQRFEVQDGDGAAMLTVDAVSRTTRFAAAAPPVIPAIDSTARDALTAVDGMLIFNTTTGTLEVYYDEAWVAMALPA